MEAAFLGQHSHYRVDTRNHSVLIGSRSDRNNPDFQISGHPRRPARRLSPSPKGAAGESDGLEEGEAIGE